MPVPFHGEVGNEKSVLLLYLPILNRTRKADEIDAVAFVGCNEMLGADISGIDQVFDRSQALGGERGVDRLRAHGLMDIGRRGVGV